MSELHEEFERRARLEAGQRRRVDFDDQQRELSGLEAGRMPRFLTATTREARGDRSKGSDKSGDGLSRLQQLLLNDPAYAALYNDTMDKLRAAENAADAALQRLIERRGQLRDEIEPLRDRAAKLPDGMAVFRAEDGSVWTEHDEKVTDPERLDSIVWPDDAPAHEAWRGKHDELARVNSGVREVRDVLNNTLAPVRNEITENDNPMSADRLETHRHTLKGVFEKYSAQPIQSPDQQTLTSQSIALSPNDIPKMP
jgi:hypothetical protein